MALNRKLTKASFDALDAVLKPHYKANATNADEYLLDADDAGELNRALDRERQNASTLQTQITTLQTELQNLKDGTARSSGDIATLEASWKKKLEAKEKELNGSIEKLQGVLRKSLVEDKALALATKLAGDNAEVMLPHIKARLSVDLASEVPTTRVLDASGNLSASSIDDLEKEFVANKKFSAILIASRASGSATGGTSGTTAVPQGKKFAELNEQERVAMFKQNPSEFERLSNENKAAQRGMGF